MEYEVTIAPEGYQRCSPIPTIAQLQKYYREEFYQSEKPGFINDSSKDVRDIDSDFYNLQYAIFSRLLKVDEFSHHVDLGCGYGHFLQYLSVQNPTLDLIGCEVYSEASDYINNIENAIFKEIDLNNFSNLKDCIEGASGVSLINTLEHLRDPVLFLKEYKRHASTKTKLLIQVPNDFNPIQKAAVSQFKLDEWWFCPPRHVSYFNPQSLRDCVESVGMKVTDMITTFPIDMFLLTGFNYRSEPSLGRKAHQMRSLFEANFSNANGLDGLIKLYRGFAQAGIGREIIAIIEIP